MAANVINTSEELVTDIEISSEVITEYRHLRRGDQLGVKGHMAAGLLPYYHHGIFIGHEQGIADFGGNDKKDATLRVVDLLRFTDNGKRTLIRINYPAGQCLPPEIAAQNAEKLVADPTHWGAYNLFENNCEHFATKCKTGVAVSKQVIEKINACIEKSQQAAAVGAVCSSVVGLSANLRLF